MPFYFFFASVLSSVQLLKPYGWKTYCKTVNHSFVQLAALFESSRKLLDFFFTLRDDPNANQGKAVYRVIQITTWQVYCEKPTCNKQYDKHETIKQEKNTASSYTGHQIKF